MVLLTGFGNPLLDITVKIQDDTLLKNYNLNADDQKEISGKDMKMLLHDISKYNSTCSPGGCAQNTMRVLQWVLNSPQSTAMFGAIGDDKQGEELKNLVEAAGVQTWYIAHPTDPTGTSVALVQGTNRSLVAYLGAAELISEDNLKTDKYFSLLKNTDIIYMESFFLPKRISVACFVQEFCEENNKLFTFNLSAPYMSETHPNDMTHFVKKSDIIFGNQKEFSALAKAMNLCITLEDFIVSLSNDYAGKGTPYGKIIVMTNGSKTVTCAHSNGKVEQVLVPPIEISKIGDTTGAGDAFVAGFMAGLIKNRMPNVCLKWGCWVATQIIQQVGCTVPQYSADYLENIV